MTSITIDGESFLITMIEDEKTVAVRPAENGRVSILTINKGEITIVSRKIPWLNDILTHQRLPLR